MSTSRGFYYALYSYHPHRVQQSVGETSDAGSESVASFLRKEAVSDGDFSLTCSRHSLESLAVETQLRDFIARRLSRGSVYTGSGNVVSVEVKDSHAPLSCYFCLLRVSPPSEDAAATAGLDSTPVDFKRRSPEYVVCYLSDRVEIDLLPFRCELDSHAQGLQVLLQQENPRDSSQVTSDVVLHLQSWHRTHLFYISRCIECIGSRLPAVLYASLCCLPMDVLTTADSQCSEDDLQRFFTVCSLTALIQAQSQPVAMESLSLIDMSSLPAEGATSDQLADSNDGGRVSIKVTADGCSMSMHTTNRFCEEWAVAVRCVPDKDNPSIVRQIVENHKLKAIQHMNTLKRLARSAETDHYTLYRAFVFVETCGMGQVLLSAAMKEAQDAGSHDSHGVCRALKEFTASLPTSARPEMLLGET